MRSGRAARAFVGVCLTALGGGGCALEVLPPLGLPCATDDDCPADYRCLGGELCAPAGDVDAGPSDAGPDDGGTPDGGSPDGGAPPEPGRVLPDYLVVTLGRSLTVPLRMDGDATAITVTALRGVATVDGVTLSYTAPITPDRDTIAVTFTGGATELIVDVVDPASFDQVWTGGGGATFADPANWQGGAPTASVLIPAGTPAALVDADLNLEELVIETGVRVDAEDATLLATIAARVGGTFSPRSLVYVGGEVAGHFDDLTIGANAALDAPTLVTDDLVVAGPTACTFDAAGETLEVLGDLTTTDYGRLRMADPDARVVVRGDAAFRGGTTNDGSLAAGVLELHGNFTQAQNIYVGPTQFVASGNHRVRLIGGSQQSIAFENPTSSVFADLEVGGAGAQLATAVVVLGELEVRAGTRLTARSGPLEVRGEVATQPGAVLEAQRLLVSHPMAFADPAGFEIDELIVDDGTETLPPELPYLDVEVHGPVEADGAPIIGGTLTVTEANGALSVREAHVTVSGDFGTDNRGVLVMDDGQGVFEVLGLATFAGGASDALSAGTLVLHAGLREQYNMYVGGDMLVATNLHVTRFEGGPQSVSFDDPGTGNYTSSLRHVEVATGADVTFETDVFITGDLTVSGALHIAGTHIVTVSGATVVNGAIDGGTLVPNGGCSGTGTGCP
ncbi:MAG: hypothetical protein HYS27_11415 [Deltaproteobacteria bacterium]|nr:hypothetical protein [Deltaproteobacteria bacterium]